MEFVPELELRNRAARLQKLLVNEGLDAALVTQNADLFYFAGIVNRAYLYIPAEGEPVLFLARGAERAHAETRLRKVADLQQLKDLPAMIREMGYALPERMGMECDVLPVALYFRYEKIFSPTSLADASPLIRNVRMIKSEWELDKIRSAGRLGREIFAFVDRVIQAGMLEFELCGQIECFARKNGHPGVMRARGFNQEMQWLLVVSGADAVLPGYNSGPLGGRGATAAYPSGASNRRIGRHEPVLIDQSPWFEGYIADMTRVFAAGSLPTHMLHGYDTALDIQRMLKRNARPGYICSELWATARQIVRTNGLCEHFMGMMRQVGFVGHGAGLEVDEWPIIGPSSDMALAEGMVIAVEPKFVFPDGPIGLENTFVVRKEGLEPLVEMDDGIRYFG